MEDFKFWSVLLGETESPVFVIVLFVMGLGLTLSKRAAEIQGPLGAAARWLRDRKVRRIEHTQRLWRTQYLAQEEQKDARIADLTEQVQYLKEELRLTRRELRETLAQISLSVGNVNQRLDNPVVIPEPRTGEQLAVVYATD